MNIVVCMKAVKSDLVFSNGESTEPFFFNPYDLKALEQCIERKNGAEDTLICLLMGPKDAVGVLEKSLAMGADEAVFLCDSQFAGSDTIATSYILSKALEKLPHPDLIVCGEKAVDGETGQVVYGLGERLGIPVQSDVSAIESLDKQQWSVVRKSNEKVSRVTGCYPVVMAVNEFTTVYPKLSLLKIKRAKSKPFHTWDASSIEADINKCGLKGSRTQVKKVRQCFTRRNMSEITGTTEEKAAFLMKQLDVERNH